MTAGKTNDAESSLLDSLRRMVEIALDPHLDRRGKLRRLTSVVVTDFPRAMFKLQVTDEESTLRVVPEFVTPLLQSIVDRYRSTLGPLDVRDSFLPRGTDSLIEAGILSDEETRLTSPEEIERYYAAHFAHADRERLGRVIREDLRVREVVLFPVRPDDLPFGVISVSTTRQLADAQTSYWRAAAAAVTAIYRDANRRLVEGLKTLAFATSDAPSVLVDSEGNPLDANRAAIAILGYSDRASTLRHLGNLRPCLPSRNDLGADDRVGAFYLGDATGGEVPCTTEVERLTDGEGRELGAVVRFHPVESLEQRSVRLTARQREVARLIAEGMTTKEVALHLGLSVHTVNYHRAQIRDRLSEAGSSGDLRTSIRQFFLGAR